ncbi:hypothetical protein CF336_g9200, partial [Tilletia laevis]
ISPPSFDLLPRPKIRPAGVETQLLDLEYGLFKPLKDKGVFKNVSLSGGAILFGPPGTGKTSIVGLVAATARVPVVVLRTNTVHSKWIHTLLPSHAELLLLLLLLLLLIRVRANIFKEARDNAPSAILIDELECVFPSRVASTATEAHKAMLYQLLTELDDSKNARERRHRDHQLSTNTSTQPSQPSQQSSSVSAQRSRQFWTSHQQTHLVRLIKDKQDFQTMFLPGHNEAIPDKLKMQGNPMLRGMSREIFPADEQKTPDQMRQKIKGLCKTYFRERD